MDGISVSLKVAIVLGGAESVWQDLTQACTLAPAATIIGTNHAARDFDGHLDHWATMHGEIIPMWIAARKAAGRTGGYQIWLPQHRRVSLPGARLIASRGGSSGLFATVVAIEHLKIDRVMLCGVPMNQNCSHYDDPRKWREAVQYLPAWRRYLPALTGKVRSFGGDTMKMLGAPNEEWLNGKPDDE